MYRITKPKGNNQNITLENIETKASVMLGKLTIDIMKILEADMGGFDERDDVKGIKFKDEWDFRISTTAGKDLLKLAMPIKKPHRDQSKPKTEEVVEETPKRTNKQPVDVFNLIFGIE